jgi:hypothetical protein
MIRIEQNQRLKDDPHVLVAVPTGDYDEMDLLECYAEGGDPDVPTCMYQAQYIIFGRPIYEQSEELTEDQVADLLRNRPAHEVINNRKLIDGKKRASKYVGRVVGRKGKLGKKDLKSKIKADGSATSTPVFSDPEPVVEPKIERPGDIVSTSTPSGPVNEVVAETASSSPIEIPVATSSVAEIPVTEASSSSPVIEAAATSSEAVVPDIEAATSTPVIEAMPSSTVPVIEPASTTTSTTTEEIVAYAKRKIARRLGL